MADRGWKRRFDEPIPLTRGRQLVTLQDAGTYIMHLNANVPAAYFGVPAAQVVEVGLEVEI